MQSHLLPNRREFLAIAATCVSATPLAAAFSEPRDQYLPYLGRSLHDWIDAIAEQSPESSHVVEALSAYGRPAVTAAFQRSFHASCGISEQRIRRLFHLVASRDLGVIDDLLKVSADDPWHARVCLDLIAPFIDSSAAVVRAMQKEAGRSEFPSDRRYYSDLLLNAGIPVPLSHIEPAVLESEADHESEELCSRQDLVDLIRVLLRADGRESLKASLFGRVTRLLGRLSDDESAAFVADLKHCGEWGCEALVDFAVSNLRNTSRLACLLLSESAEQTFPIVRSLLLSQETDRRIAAFRILAHRLEVPFDLLELARSNLDHQDPGVCGLAALTLLKQRVDREHAKTVLAGTIRRPELRYRRWIMEGLAGFAGSVDEVDRHLMKLLVDDDEDVRYYAIRRVRQLGYNSSDMVQLVGNIWRGGTKADAFQRAEAFEYLVEQGKDAILIARTALNGKNPRAHHEAISLLGRLGPQAIEAAPELTAFWAHSELWKRVMILLSLYRMEAYVHLRPLVVEALNSHDRELFRIAAAMLSVASRSDFVELWPLVRKGLRSRDCDMQNAAAVSVTNYGAEAVGDLLALFSSDDPYDRAGATKGLRTCQNDSLRVQAALRKAALDPDLAVRCAASERLIA